MKPEQTGEVLSNIFSISNRQVNFYLVKINQKYIAFDTGASKKISLQELNKLHIKTDDVAAIFITHTDSDHIGGIDLFPHVNVYISKREEQMIDGSTRRMIFMKNKLKCSYKTLEDGETVDIDGVSIKCIITPGHTNGSACYIVDGKYLFSGDSFSLKNGKTMPFISFLNMDGHEHRKSIVKISGFQNIEAIFTGHHGYTKNFTEAFADWQKLNDEVSRR